ncbi:MAG: T9SS type A sorting domain-containing protein [Bacteroidetes bacterium]|nr:T9SS type A sorting domain-containing protein [Bacteroidota bacterium]
MKKLVFLIIGLAFLTFKNQAQTVTDYDGNVYDTVMIGTQAWLKENLKVTHYNNGVPIPNVTANTAWAALLTGARCYYTNDSLANDSVYGPLYNWYAVNDANNLCPSGWKVPANDEWQTAEAYLGGSGVAGGEMKEAGTLHWISPNTGATNSTSFTGLPGGMRDPINNNFRTITENGLWWTSTVSGSNAWSTYMWYLYAGVDHNPGTKKYGFSVRCVKDLAYGMKDINSPGNFKLYPNPSTNRVFIECAENLDIKLFVYNLFGYLVMEQILTKGTNDVDISSLPKGVYILKTSDEREPWQQKMIKE